MENVSIIALFCEDIREETAGTSTIVGVYPDNLSVPHLPGIFPKICVYVRTHIRTEFDAGPFFIRIVMPGGKELSRSEAKLEMVDNIRAKARSKGAPYAGFISKFVVAPFEITEVGRIRAIVNIGGQEYVAGALNIELAPQGEQQGGDG
jgi:hypothetical protein